MLLLMATSTLKYTVNRQLHENMWMAHIKLASSVRAAAHARWYAGTDWKVFGTSAPRCSASPGCGKRTVLSAATTLAGAAAALTGLNACGCA